MHDAPGDHDDDLEESPKIAEDISGYYEQGKEEGRLTNTPEGQLEFARTQDLLSRFLPKAPAVVLDIGGGPGPYACWLATLGYEVHLVDPVPLHVQQAKAASARQPAHPIASCTVGDARELNFPDAGADAVLLFGPLYHLTDSNDRKWALEETRRVLKPRGLVFGMGISRFAATLDGLRRKLIDDPEYIEIMERGLESGEHHNTSSKGEDYFTTSYLHQPNELRREMANVGFQQTEAYAVEGPAWLMAELGHYLKPERSATLLRILGTLETEASLIGTSGHILAIGRKPG